MNTYYTTRQFQAEAVYAFPNDGHEGFSILKVGAGVRGLRWTKTEMTWEYPYGSFGVRISRKQAEKIVGRKTLRKAIQPGQSSRSF